jgi:hypothetical protein
MISTAFRYHERRGYTPNKVNSFMTYQTSTSISAHLFPSEINQDNEYRLKQSNLPFDFDFADAMSKPLPDWFQKERDEREKYLRDVEENRERIMREFRQRYEISEAEKAAVREARWLKYKAKLESKKKNWLGSLFAVGTAVDEDREETTRERWEKLWEENKDEEEEVFMLPGFFEVFPELKLKWPIWSKRNGGLQKCETDRDCPVPQACCPHPLLPGDKFCCTGFGRRVMEPAYAPQEAVVRRDIDGDQDRANEDEERRRRGKKPWENLDD